MKLCVARVPFTTCPLCGGEELLDVLEADCSAHPLHHGDLEPTQLWRGCGRCGHVFTAGWLDEEARARLSAAADAELPPGRDPARGRLDAASIVERVAGLAGSGSGRWLDAELGSGALLATAEELGYEALGLSPLEAAVAAMAELGYPAALGRLEDLEEPEAFDVVSLANVLPRVPFPAETLAAAHRLLRPGGHLFVSAPNLQSFTWRVLQQAERNPFWSEPLHHHNFSREHLCWLLKRSGFEPVHSAVSRSHPCGLELVARRV